MQASPRAAGAPSPRGSGCRGGGGGGGDRRPRQPGERLAAGAGGAGLRQRRGETLTEARSGGAIGERCRESGRHRAEVIETERRIADFDEQLAVVGGGVEQAPRRVDARIARRSEDL